MPQEMSTRKAYGRALVELGEKNPDIVVLDADLSMSTMTHMFAQRFPHRFFDCGIAEQNMIGIAAGLAASGKIPFASTFAVFVPGRCFDQLRLSVAQSQLNVKIVATHGGITSGEDGFSHHAIEDLALICALPGFYVLVPTDAIETTQMVRTAAVTPAPFYIRLSRPSTPVIFDENYHFVLGKAVTLRQGNDAAIIAIGIMVSRALEAAKHLAQEGIECRVVSMPTIKPLDEEAILQSAKETGAIVTAEEHLKHGGLGSRVAQVVAQHYAIPMDFVAIEDTYARSGKAEELLQRYGLTAPAIEQAVKSAISRKQVHHS